MTSSTERTHEQCLSELKKLSIHSLSLDEYLEKTVLLIKDKLDFLFVGIAFLEPDYSVKFYLSTGDRYKKRMGLSLESSDPISLTIRNGRPLLMDLEANANMFKDPEFPEATIWFFLPLKSQEGVFGTMEIVSAVQLDEDHKIKVIANLETLSIEVASSCSRLMDKRTIGFWKESAP